MINFQIPRNSSMLYTSISCQETESIPEPIISNSLSFYLSDIKKRIDHQEHEWDIFKRYTNPYEYIHTNVPNKRKSIAKCKPLSRSYFKMIEIVQFFHLLDRHSGNSSLKTFHLAEGPGGFIEALVDMRSASASTSATMNARSDEYIGMTILDDVSDPNIPAWKKSQRFLNDNPNVRVELGVDGTGDILSLANFRYCCKTYRSSMDMITGDGGFDFSIDFNSQENHITKLLFGQVVYALSMQKRGGSFILKVFDCFMQHTLDILAILSSFYEKVYITKPQTSRYANSEKYIVCKGFLFPMTVEFENQLDTAFSHMLSSEQPYIKRFLNVPLSLTFLSRMEEYNAIFGQQQIENIYYTLSLIDNKNKQDKIDNLIKLNTQKCIYWCIKYNVQCSPLVVSNNFLSE